ANRIAVPKGDEDLKQKTKFCFDFLKDLKEKGSPSGVTLHQLYAKPNKGKYREGEEYEITKESLGEGNMSAGKILVVKDKTTGKENAMKTVMIADFREDEVQCWIDLNDSGLPPRLYLFHYDSSDNKVKFHMEPLKKAKLLQEVIDEHMGKMWRTNSELVKPFSLCMFDNVLSAIKTMTDKNWTHGDLHGKNIMLDNKMRLRVLDFGRAKPLSVDTTSGKGDNFKMDILEAVRKFTALYLGYEFEDQFDLKANWTQMLSDERLSSVEERSDLFNLIDSALRIQHPSDIPQVKDTIQKMLLDKKRDDIMREVARLLFPEEDLESYSTMDGPRVYVGYTVGNIHYTVGDKPRRYNCVSNSISNIYLSEPQNTVRLSPK
ncbi:hypothetical protein FSP39_022492, partial [Pinctada imbricata]